MKNKTLLKRTSKFLPFLAMVFFTLLIGNLLTQAEHALPYSSLIAGRLIVAFLLIQILLLEGSFIDFVDALVNMKFPIKLCIIMYLMDRYVQLLFKDFKKIKCTLQSRFFINKTTVFSLSTWGNILGNIVVRIHEKADKIYLAMKSRGINSSALYLRREYAFRIEVTDILFSLSFISIAVISISL